jgi:hypothetical protein
MSANSNRLLSFEMAACIAIRTADGLIRGKTLGQDRFSPQRYLTISISYAGLGALAALGDALGDVAAAMGGLVLLATVLSAVPSGNGQTVGSEVGAAFSKLGNPSSSS